MPRAYTPAELAALCRDMHPTLDDSKPVRYYRVQGDWCGGGFGYTKPFESEAEARAWGEHKARFHRDAVITVEDRGPDEPKAERFHRLNDRRALLIQVREQDCGVVR